MDERHHSDPRPDYDDWHSWLRDMFPEYAVAMVLGQPPGARCRALAVHLEDCPACRAELEELIDFVAPAYNGQLAHTPSSRPMNLSFLAAPAKPRQPWFIDDLRRLVVEFSEALLMSLRPLAQAARGQALYRYTLDPPPENMTVTIEVFSGDDDPNLGNVQVLVDVPSLDPFDQSGIHVCLSLDDRSWDGVTSETGSVTFATVPLDQLARLRVVIALPAFS